MKLFTVIKLFFDIWPPLDYRKPGPGNSRHMWRKGEGKTPLKITDTCLIEGPTPANKVDFGGEFENSLLTYPSTNALYYLLCFVRFFGTIYKTIRGKRN